MTPMRATGFAPAHALHPQGSTNGRAQRLSGSVPAGWHRLWLVFILMLVGAGWGYGHAAASSLTDLSHVRLALQWKPQSQFAGYYLARARGLYREAGLDVTLLHATPERDALNILEDGDADLATAFLADGLLRAPRLVQVAQMVNRSNLMILAWKDMGVSRVQDLEGRRISLWRQAFTTEFDTFFARHGVRPRPIPQRYSINLFLNRGVAACAAMEYNEYHRIWQAGIDAGAITPFLMRDHGLGFPEDGIYAKAEWFNRNAEVARRFRQATLAGWEMARANPEEAIALVLDEARKANVPANRSHERWMLRHILESIFIPGAKSSPGVLDRTAFDTTVTALQAAGLLRKQIDFAAFAPLESALR